MSYLCIKTPTCSAVEEGAEQLDLRLQFSQPEVNWLVVEDGLLEDLPLPRVLDGLLNDVVHRGQDWRRQDREVEMWPHYYCCVLVGIMQVVTFLLSLMAVMVSLIVPQIYDITPKSLPGQTD